MNIVIRLRRHPEGRTFLLFAFRDLNNTGRKRKRVRVKRPRTLLDDPLGAIHLIFSSPPDFNITLLLTLSEHSSGCSIVTEFPPSQPSFVD